MDNAVLVEELFLGSNLILGGNLGEKAHQLYNGGDGKHMDIFEIIFLCGLPRLPAYLVV